MSSSLPQVSDNQRVDPLGSWMDFVKRPVDNFPGKCRKRKRPLVNPEDAVCLAVSLKLNSLLKFYHEILHVYKMVPRNTAS